MKTFTLISSELIAILILIGDVVLTMGKATITDDLAAN
jgi:hypothetical protein